MLLAVGLISFYIAVETNAECILDMPLLNDNLKDKINPERKVKVRNPQWKKSGNHKLIYFSESCLTIGSEGLTVPKPTIAVWVKPDIWDTIKGEVFLIGPGVSGNGYHTGYCFLFKNQGGRKQLQVTINFNGTPTSMYYGGISAREFSHIAVTYDGKQARLYINGKPAVKKRGDVTSLEDDKGINYFVHKDKKRTKLTPVILGGVAWGPFKGYINGLKIFDTALNAEEIKKIYEEGKAVYHLPEKQEAAKTASPSSFFPSDKLTLPNRGLCRNLLPNPSFEAGLRYWGNVEFVRPYHSPDTRFYNLDETVAHTGGNSLRLVGRKDEWGGIMIRSFAVPVKTGRKYTVSFFARRGKQAACLNAGIIHGDWPTAIKDRTFVLSPEWKRYSYSFIAPDAVAAVTLLLRKDQETEAWIDDLQLEEGESAGPFTYKQLASELVTDHFDNLFNLGEKIEPCLRIITAPHNKGKVNIKIYNFPGKEISGKNYSFSAGSNGEAKIPLDLSKTVTENTGIYYVRADFELDNGFKDYDYYRFGIMRYLDNTHKNKNVFGYYCPQRAFWIPDIKTAVRKYKEMGIGMMNSNGSVIKPEMRKILEGSNIEVTSRVFIKGDCDPLTGWMPQPSQYPALKEMRKKRPYMPVKYNVMAKVNDIDRLREEVESIVKRNPDINCWGLVGEPIYEVTSDPKLLKEFVKFNQAATLAIKKIPGKKVLAPSPCNMYSIGRGQVKTLMEAGLDQKYCDIFAIHPYRPRPEHPDIDADTATFIKMLSDHKFSGDIWFTEGVNYPPYHIPSLGITPTKFANFWYGGSFSYDIGFGERQAAAYIARMYLAVFKYIDRVKTLWDGGQYYYIDLNRTPRAVCWVPNVLGNILGNASFVKDISVNDKARGYLFIDGKKRPVAVIWNIDEDVDDGKAPPVEISIPFNENEVELIDFMGGKAEIKSLTKVPVTPYPLFIRGKAGSGKEFSRKLAAISGGRQTPFKTDISFTDTENLRLQIRNNLYKPLAGLLTIKCGQFSLEKERISLQARQDKTFNIPYRLNNGKMNQVKVRIGFADAKGGKEVQVAEDFPAGIIRKADEPIKIDGSLADWGEKYIIADGFNFTRDIGHVAGSRYLKIKEHVEKWQGRNDLSATFYCSWDSKYLYMALKVKDSKLVLANTEHEFFRYDSLQVYFDTFNDARKHAFKGYDNNDYCYNFIKQKNGVFEVTRRPVPEQQISFLKEGKAPKIQRCFKQIEGGYVYEIAFPASEIVPISLKNGTTFGFSMVIWDNDENYVKRGLTLNPEGTVPYMAPHLWPTMILSK